MLLVTLCLLLGSRICRAQDLQISYGSKGVQTLAFRGVPLVNTAANPADTFHIWHMRSTDMQGNVLSQGSYGWGETNLSEVWNEATNTEVYSFNWGTIATQFVQRGNNLDMIVTETNYPASGILFNGAEIYPFALHFPSEPTNFYGYSQYAITTTGPGVSVADFGSGVVTSVIPNEALAMYGGWKNEGAHTYSPIMTTTAPDGLASFLPSVNSTVPPGSSLTYTVSLRFTPEGTAADASDAYSSFAAMYPSQMTWADHRMIGTAYLASSPQNNGDITVPGGFPTNPRRYFNDASVDITTPGGLLAFQNRMLAQAASNATNAQALHAQGVITWDIEGEQFPQSTSYVCSPDQIAAVAPEMESTVLDQSSPFYGRKLDDAYFATMKNAGLRTGVCLRPQLFTLHSNGTADQTYLDGNAAITANLEMKAKYANDRWGTTIFYVDSTVYANGGTLDPAIFQQLITDLPAFLFIPEESTPRYYAYSAPFYSFLFHTDLGTSASIYNAYPHAFGANLVNDASAATLAAYTPQLTGSVSKGDILMGHADFWQANDPTLLAIYTAAGAVNPEPPTKSTPVITWVAPAQITYGTALTSQQLNPVSSVAGNFIFSPALGTVLSAGSHILSATLTPADPTLYGAASATVSLTVAQAKPILSWATPSAVNAGTPLSDAQLDATANIPGSFVYLPGQGTVLQPGSNTLSAVFTPSDTVDYQTAAISVPFVVNAVAAPTGPLTILTPSARSTVSGVVTVSASVKLFLDAAGTFLIVDGVGLDAHRVTSAPFLYPLDTRTLSNGLHTLQLWGHDIGNNTRLSNPISITVAN